MRVALGAMLMLASLRWSFLSAQECPPLGLDTSSKIAHYLDARTVSGETLKIEIVASELVPNSCYLKLTIKASIIPHPIFLFISPDRRFISNNLFDLDEPSDVASLSARQIQQRLVSESSPRLGSSQHVLVEFGDFECPYCSDFARWFNSVPSEMRQRYSLIFKHLPLPQHPWAMSVAQLMACVQKISPEEFWPIYSYIYESQRDITLSNFQTKILDRFQQDNTPNRELVAKCFADRAASGIVSRDINTAALLHVHSTPTLFLDGYRVLPIKSEEDLVELLRKHSD